MIKKCMNQVQISAIECYKQAWQRIKKNFWYLVALCLIANLISSFSNGILSGVMICSMFAACLDVIDNENPDTSFRKLFDGFNYFLPSLLLIIIASIPIAITVILLLTLSALIKNIDFSPQLVLAVWMIAAFLAIVLMVCLHSLMIFSFLLVVDKNMSALQSILISSQAVWSNLGLVVNVLLISFLLSIIGLLACCIGVYFVFPINLAAITLIYRQIFPAISYEPRT
ncbi:MAG: hypothetical protein D6735_00300 [Acidobacteria bacterium]|nr:MAG: hypothetical protein D6735_00300 [Acidobacteriota bacterium]